MKIDRFDTAKALMGDDAPLSTRTDSDKDKLERCSGSAKIPPPNLARTPRYVDDCEDEVACVRVRGLTPRYDAKVGYFRGFLLFDATMSLKLTYLQNVTNTMICLSSVRFGVQLSVLV